MAIALSIYLQSKRNDAESARAEMRAEETYAVQHAIDAYMIDKGKVPQSLNDLVIDGYLKSIPGERAPEIDPIPLQKGRT